MPRPLVLAAVFLLSLLFWLLWNFPAGPLVTRADGLVLAGEPLRLVDVAGRARDGQLRWSWQGHSGRASWRLAWRELRPGLELRLEGEGVHLDGWLSGGSDSLSVRQLNLDVPVAPIAERIPEGDADGRVEGQVERLQWRSGAVPQVSGVLHYSGGQMSWPDGQARVPRLDGELFSDDEAGWLVVRSPDGTRLMDGRLSPGEAEFRLYRAWAELLGASAGGEPDDVIFRVNEAFSVP